MTSLVKTGPNTECVVLPTGVVSNVDHHIIAIFFLTLFGTLDLIRTETIIVILRTGHRQVYVVLNNDQVYSTAFSINYQIHWTQIENMHRKR